MQVFKGLFMSILALSVGILVENTAQAGCDPCPLRSGMGDVCVKDPSGPNVDAYCTFDTTNCKTTSPTLSEETTFNIAWAVVTVNRSNHNLDESLLPALSDIQTTYFSNISQENKDFFIASIDELLKDHSKLVQKVGNDTFTKFYVRVLWEVSGRTEILSPEFYNTPWENKHASVSETILMNGILDTLTDYVAFSDN